MSKSLLIRGLRSSEYLNKELFDSYISIAQAAYESGECHEVANYLSAVDIHALLTMYPMGNNRMVCFISDLSEMNRANSEYSRQSVVLSNLFDSLPVGIKIYDNEGALVDINKYDVEMFGVNEKEDVLGVNFFDDTNIPTETKLKILSNDEVTFRINYSFDKVKGYYDTRNDSSITIVSTLSKLYDSDGEQVCFVCVNIDETEMNQLSTQSHDYKYIFDRIGSVGKIGYCYFDPYTGEGSALPQWNTNMGESPDAPLTDVFALFQSLDEENKVELQKSVDAIISGEINRVTHDVRINSKDGSSSSWTRVVLMRDHSINNTAASDTQLLSLNYDITAQKESELELLRATEQAQISSKLKTSFLANMSHEIRTSLNAIIGFSELLSDCDDPSERELYMTILNENSDMLLQIITDIWEKSRVQSGELELNYTDVNPYSLCVDVMQSIQVSYDVLVDFQLVSQNVDWTINTEPTHLKQVLIGFITKSLKSLNSGNIRFGFELLSDGYLRFFVNDNGLVESKRESDNNKREEESDFDFSLYRTIAEQMNAEFGIDFKADQGTTTWITLPVDKINIKAIS